MEAHNRGYNTPSRIDWRFCDGKVHVVVTNTYVFFNGYHINDKAL